MGIKNQKRKKKLDQKIILSSLICCNKIEISNKLPVYITETLNKLTYLNLIYFHNAQ